MSVYADTSFLVSLYIEDRHSGEAQRRITSKPLLLVTPLHRAEWVHAVEQHIFRGHISPHEAREVYEDFEEDESAGLWARVDLPPGAFERCAELARRYAARFGNRTLDSLHVASAIELKMDTFWTFDDRQRKLATAEGLTII